MTDVDREHTDFWHELDTTLHDFLIVTNERICRFYDLGTYKLHEASNKIIR